MNDHTRNVHPQMLPFRVIGIAEDETGVQAILESAVQYPRTGTALMLRDRHHRSERVCELAGYACSCRIPPNLFLMTNSCDIPGIEWRNLTSHELRAGVKPQVRFGCSVHSFQELKLAEEAGASYVLVSPVFRTSSKPDADPIGVEGLSEFCARTKLPVFALGGLMTAEQVRKSLETGAWGVAGITLFRPEQRPALQSIMPKVELPTTLR